MKRLIRMIGMLALFAALLCVSALAADAGTGITNVSPEAGYSQKFLDAGGNEVKVNGEGVYENVAKIELTIDSTQNGAYELFYLMKGAQTAAPAEDNLYYIDQLSGTSSALTVTLYPKTLDGGDYTLMRVNNNGVSEAALTFKVTQAYKLGDANMDKAVNIQDAVAVLEYCVGSRSLDGSAKTAADANKDKSVNIQDAVAILEYCVGSRVL